MSALLTDYVFRSFTEDDYYVLQDVIDFAYELFSVKISIINYWVSPLEIIFSLLLFSILCTVIHQLREM